MILMSLWIDSHCHMADPRLAACLESWLDEAQGRGLSYFVQGGMGPEDWNRQEHLAKKFKNQIGLCFGLHPYWISDQSQEACELAMDLLALRIAEAQLLGETGLDFRPKILRGDGQVQERQISFFEMQLELASTAAKPVVLHVVQAHEEALRVLDLWGVPSRKGFVHSFNGSAKKAEDFLNRGLLISVGGPLVRPDNQKLKQAVEVIPLECLLLETDSPDQPPPNYSGKLNPLISLFEVAEEVARIKGLSWREVLDISRENLKNLLRLKENPDGTYSTYS